MATNRPDTLDPALVRLGHLNCKIEIALQDLGKRLEFARCKKRLENATKARKTTNFQKICNDRICIYKKQNVSKYKRGRANFFELPVFCIFKLFFGYRQTFTAFIS
jgi:hypothetical protein